MAEDQRSDGAHLGAVSGFQPTIVAFARDDDSSETLSREALPVFGTAPDEGAADGFFSRGRRRVVFGIAASVFWLALGLGFVVQSPEFSSSLLALSLPAAAAAAVLTTLPPAILWLFLLLSDRNALYRADIQVIRRQLALLSYPAHAAEKNIASIADAIRSQTQELSDATRNAAMQAETLRAVLARESRELARIAEHVDRDSSDRLVRVAEKTKRLEILLGQAGALSANMDAALRQGQDGLDQIADKTLRNAETLSLSLSRQHAALAATAADINRQTAVVEALLLRQERGLAETRDLTASFAQAGETLTDLGGHASRSLSTQVAVMGETLERLEGSGDKLARLFDALHRQETALESVFEQRAHAMAEHQGQIADSAKRAVADIDAATAKAAENLAVFRQGAAALIDSARQAGLTMSETTQTADASQRLLQQRSIELGETAAKLALEMRGADASLRERHDLLAQTAERSSERIYHVADLLARNAVDVTRTTARASVEIEAMSESLRAAIDRIGETAAVLQNASQGVVQAAAAASGSMGEAALGLRQGVEAVASAGAVFCEETDRLTDAGHIAVETLGILGSNIRGETQDVERTLERVAIAARRHIETVEQTLTAFLQTIEAETSQALHSGNSLRASLDLTSADAQRSLGMLTAAGEDLRAQMSALSGAVEEALERLGSASSLVYEQSGVLTNLQQDAVRDAQTAVEELARVTDGLNHSARTAEQYVHDLKKSREAVDVQRFLSECSYIVERLHAAAVDIARLFTPDLEEDLWRRFYKGEQNVFMRQVARSVTHAQKTAIKRLYAENKEFRQYAARYLGEYESILKAARNNDRADILTAVFAGSDMGRLYMVLAKALERHSGPSS